MSVKSRVSSSKTQIKSLISSSKELFLKYGVKSVSMDDIARFMGISKKTIYNVITNKNSLVVAAVSAFIKEEEKTISQLIASSENALDEMFKISRHVHQLLKSLRPSLAYDLKKYYPIAWEKVQTKHFDFIEEVIAKNIERGIKDGFYRDNLDSTVIAKLYINISTLMAREEVFNPQDYQMSEIYDFVIAYHMNGILNNTGRKEMSKYLKKNFA